MTVLWLKNAEKDYANQLYPPFCEARGCDDAAEIQVCFEGDDGADIIRDYCVECADQACLEDAENPESRTTRSGGFENPGFAR